MKKWSVRLSAKAQSYRSFFRIGWRLSVPVKYVIYIGFSLRYIMYFRVVFMYVILAFVRENPPQKPGYITKKRQLARHFIRASLPLSILYPGCILYSAAQTVARKLCLPTTIYSTFTKAQAFLLGTRVMCN